MKSLTERCMHGVRSVYSIANQAVLKNTEGLS